MNAVVSRIRHEGSIGNLCNDEITVLMQKVIDGFNFDVMQQAEQRLLNLN